MSSFFRALKFLKYETSLMFVLLTRSEESFGSEVSALMFFSFLL